MVVSVLKAFHTTPNVYKRKSKEIRMETEPCGGDCFLLQVRHLHKYWDCHRLLCVVLLIIFYLFFFLSSSLLFWRKGRKSLSIRICYDHRGLAGGGGSSSSSSSVPPAPAVLDHPGLLRKEKRTTVTMRPPLPQVMRRLIAQKQFNLTDN